MEIVDGFIAEFDKTSVVYKDIRHFGLARENLIQLTVQRGKLSFVEILISGWDDDPRPLYDVPEVRRWVNLIQKKWPDFLIWLTPDSLRTFFLCLNPGMYKKLSGGRAMIEFDTDKLTDQLAASMAHGVLALQRTGMSGNVKETVATQSYENLLRMLEQKRFGDYAVVHPTQRSVVTYRP